MDLHLKEKVVILTGASAGIGYATTQAFAQESAIVVGVSRHTSSLNTLAKRYPVTGISVDLSTPDGHQQVVDAVVQQYGRIDVLVNNAGIFESRQGFLHVSDDDWWRTLEINFMSEVRTSRSALPTMIKQGQGVIINVASEDARQPDISLVDYSVSKAAMLMLSKVVAIEFGPQGIRVNTISPGPTRTVQVEKPGGFADQLAQQFGMEREAALEQFVKDVRQLATQRMGTPEDVAAVILFLASDVASQVTGAEYTVKGGSIRGVYIPCLVRHAAPVSRFFHSRCRGKKAGSPGARSCPGKYHRQILRKDTRASLVPGVIRSAQSGRTLGDQRRIGEAAAQRGHLASEEQPGCGKCVAPAREPADTWTSKSSSNGIQDSRRKKYASAYKQPYGGSGTILFEIAVWRSGSLPRWSGIPLAVGFALYIPQFSMPQSIRVVHGLFIMLACMLLTWSMSKRNRASQ